MSNPTVAVLSPGDMGHSVGGMLRDAGLRVITCLQGRTGRSRALAGEAGIEDVADDQTLVREADMLLSILPPDRATGLAERVAAALKATGASLLYVDCNAISPNTARKVGDLVTAAGARFADAGIIGSPPRPGRGGTTIYASGDGAREFAGLASYGLTIEVLPGGAGQASGMKMCYAASTKGFTALTTELMVAAEKLGLSEALTKEFERSQPTLVPHMSRSIPTMPPKAYRWVGEMLEIAATFRDLGMTPKILEGAADMYELVGRTPLANETPESRTRGQTLEDVVQILAEGASSGE